MSVSLGANLQLKTEEPGALVGMYTNDVIQASFYVVVTTPAEFKRNSYGFISGRFLEDLQSDLRSLQYNDQIALIGRPEDMRHLQNRSVRDASKHWPCLVYKPEAPQGGVPCVVCEHLISGAHVLFPSSPHHAIEARLGIHCRCIDTFVEAIDRVWNKHTGDVIGDAI